MNEVQLMGQQQHPAVLPLYAAFLVDDQLWMVLPYVAGGSAEDVLKRQGTPVRFNTVPPSANVWWSRIRFRFKRQFAPQRTSSSGRARWYVPVQSDHSHILGFWSGLRPSSKICALRLRRLRGGRPEAAGHASACLHGLDHLTNGLGLLQKLWSGLSTTTGSKSQSKLELLQACPLAEDILKCYGNPMRV